MLSGTYTVALHRDGVTTQSSIRVNADRRVYASDADEGRGHAFQTSLYDALSNLDDALNVLDNLRLQLPARATSLQGSAGNSALIVRVRALTDQATTIEALLTSAPQNSQDDDFLEDLPRERLLTFIGSSSRSTPTSEQVREGHAIVQESGAILDRYRAFLAESVTPLARELNLAGFPLNLTEKPVPDPKPGPNVDERAVRRDE